MTTYPFLDLATINRPFQEQLTEATARIIAGGRYVGGPECEAFEHELAALTATLHCVGCSNGLDALRLIFRALIELGRLHPGDEVIVPANTYVASVLAVTDCGLKAVLAEPDPDTFNLSADSAAKVLTPSTKAILPVHLYGRMAWSEQLNKLCEANHLIVVEDNAQAIGAADPQGTMTGAIGHAAAFSFYPTKNVGALGDAGAVTTNDARLAATVRALANYGSDRRYHNIYCGYNCRLDPIQAAALRIKLAYLDEISAQRREIANVYLNSITNPAISLPHPPGVPSEHVWHQFVVLTDNRDNFRKYLSDNGVATDVHYATPPHRQPCYAGSELIRYDSLPITESLADRCVSLPVSPCTSPADAKAISLIINGYEANRNYL